MEKLVKVLKSNKIILYLVFVIGVIIGSIATTQTTISINNSIQHKVDKGEMVRLHSIEAKEIK